jgi:hypothetical protein
MRSLCLCVLCPIILAGQQPDFSGEWRLRSEAAAGGTSKSLLWVSQNGANLDIKMFSQTGTRYGWAEAIFTIGRERDGVYLRMPAKFNASWEGEVLMLEWAADWPWGEQSERHHWTVGSGGKEFSDVSTDRFGSRIRQHTAVYDREPPETAKAFDYAEQNAGEHFKNIRIVKEIPETAVTPLMATFQSALGVKCQYCHNQSAYDDDKLGTKVVARRMLAMVKDLNDREFGGRQAVTCFTCHRGKSTPDQ